MKGLYSKYIITKADGTPVEGFYFVLKPESDWRAFDALLYYASHTPNKQLAADLKRKLQDIVEDEDSYDEGLAAAYSDMRQGG